MKNKVLAVVVCCFLLTAAVAAQQKAETAPANFAGSWELNAKQSKLGDRSRIESMTMIVTQTETDLTIETAAERKELPGGGMGGRGRFGGRGMGGGPAAQNTIYKLSGEETAVPAAGPFGGETRLRAEILKDGRLKLYQTRTVETPRGQMKISIVETWELQNEGRGLKILRQTETPRGSRMMELVFTKN